MKQHKIRLSYIISFFVPIIIGFISFGIARLAPFGVKDIFTETGNAEIITNYYKLYDYVHNIFSSESIKDIWSFYMTDPTNLFCLFFSRDSIINILSIIYLIKLGLASLCFNIYLTKKTDKESENISNTITTVAFSSAYALSGYMLVYGTNISFLSVITIFPLIILAFELLINEHKWHYYYIAIAVSFILNVYATLVVLLFTFLYLLTQDFKDIKHIIKTLSYKILADILAIGSATIAIIPAMNSISANSFFTKAAPLNYTVVSFGDAFRRFLLLAEPSKTTNVDYGIDIYSGMFAIVLLFLYIFNSNYELFRKIRTLILVSILLIATIITSPNMLLNCFAKTNFNSCFFVFELIFIILVIAFETITGIEKESKKALLISVLTLFLVIVLSSIFAHTYLSISPFIYSIEVLLLYSVVLFLLLDKKIKINHFYIAFGSFAIIELIIAFISGTIKISNNNLSYEKSHSNSEYRIEMYLKSEKADSKIIKFDEYDEYFNPALNYISGVDYVLCNSNTSIPDATLSEFNTLDKVDIYSMDNPIEGNVIAPKEIIDWTYSRTSPYMSDNTLLSILSGQEVAAFTKINCTPNIVQQDYKDEAGRNYSEITILNNDYIVDTLGDTYSCYILPKYIGKTDDQGLLHQNYKLTLYNTLSYDIETTSFYHFDGSEFENAINEIKTITGSGESPYDGYIIVSVGEKPDKGISIDGKKQEIINIDDTLWVAQISKGQHTIEYTELNTISNNIPILALLSIVFILISFFLIKKPIPIIKRAFTHPYNFITDNYVYFATVIISILVYLIICEFISAIPFGRNSVLSSDGYVQTYPAIQSMINHLSLKSFAPSTIGFSSLVFSCGDDFITSTIGTAISLFYRLFIRTNNGLLYGSILSAYYMVISGPAIIFYLTHRYSGKRFDKKDSKLIVIGLLYTLCAYNIGYFSYNNFLYGIYTPIIIYALEKMVYKKKTLLYILALSFIMIRGYYSAFLLCEFIGLFFITLNFVNIKDFLKKGAGFLLSSLLAAGIAAYNLLPAFLSTLSSPYKGNDTSAGTSTNINPLVALGSTIFKSLNQYQIGQKAFAMNTDDGIVNVFTGLIPLMFVALYILNKNINKSIRIRKAIVVFILFWAFGNPALNFVFHGFHFQSNVPNRFSLFFIFMILIMFADVLLDLKEISKKRTLLSVSIAGIILIFSWAIYSEKNMNSLVLSIIFTLTYIGITFVYYYNKIDAYKFKKLLMYLCTVEIIISALLSSPSSMGYSKKSFEETIASIGKLSKDFNNNKTEEVFVSELIDTSTDNYNTGLLNDLNTISGFTSFLNDKQYELTDKWGLAVGMNNVRYGTGNPLADMMLHVKYHFINTDNDEYGKSTIYDQKQTHNNIELHENQYYLPIGFMTDSSLKAWSESDIKSYDGFMNYQNAFSQAVCGKDVYTLIDPNVGNTQVSVSIADENSYGTNDISIDMMLDDSIQGNIYIFYGNRVDYVGNTSNTIDNSFNYLIHDFYFEEDSKDTDDLEFTIALLNEDVLNEMYNIFSESKMTDFNRTKTYLSGKINVKKAGIMYLSIPNYDNMNIYVDDQKVEHFNYLHGTGINLESGEHSIKIEGELSSNTAGNTISIISILILIAFIFVNNQNKKRKLEAEES